MQRTECTNEFARDVASFIDALGRFILVANKVDDGLLSMFSLLDSQAQGDTSNSDTSGFSTVTKAVRQRYFDGFDAAVHTVPREGSFFITIPNIPATAHVADIALWGNHYVLSVDALPQNPQSTIVMNIGQQIKTVVQCTPWFSSKSAPGIIPLTDDWILRDSSPDCKVALKTLLYCLFFSVEPSQWRYRKPETAAENILVSGLIALRNDLCSHAVPVQFDVPSLSPVDPDVVRSFISFVRFVSSNSRNDTAIQSSLHSQTETLKDMGHFYNKMFCDLGFDLQSKQYYGAAVRLDNKDIVDESILLRFLDKPYSVFSPQLALEVLRFTNSNATSINVLASSPYEMPECRGFNMFLQLNDNLASRSSKQISAIVEALDGPVAEAYTLLFSFAEAIKRNFAFELLCQQV